jgi:hypothetical protein
LALLYANKATSGLAGADVYSFRIQIALLLNEKNGEEEV